VVRGSRLHCAKRVTPSQQNIGSSKAHLDWDDAVQQSQLIKLSILEPVLRFLRDAVAKSGRAVALGAACAFLTVQQLPAAAEAVLRVPASETPEVFAVQQTMLEAWHIIAESFEDPTFGGLSWEDTLRDSLVAAYNADSPAEARQQLVAMVAKLGDPYTRMIPANEYRDFRVASDGELQGVGLMIAQDPASRRLLVLASLAGSPAARAGVLPGDEVRALMRAC